MTWILCVCHRNGYFVNNTGGVKCIWFLIVRNGWSFPKIFIKAAKDGLANEMGKCKFGMVHDVPKSIKPVFVFYL